MITQLFYLTISVPLIVFKIPIVAHLILDTLFIRYFCSTPSIRFDSRRKGFPKSIALIRFGGFTFFWLQGVKHYKKCWFFNDFSV